MGDISARSKEVDSTNFYCDTLPLFANMACLLV